MPVLFWPDVTASAISCVTVASLIALAAGQEQPLNRACALCAAVQMVAISFVPQGHLQETEK